MTTDLTQVSGNIDEFSAVIFIRKSKNEKKDAENVRNFIDEFVRKFQLMLYYGEPKDTGLQGYSVTMNYNGLFFIGYHDKLLSQGIYVRFTSSGLDDLAHRLDLTTLGIIKLVDEFVRSFDYVEKWRMSRVDLCLDFIDWHISDMTGYLNVADIYKRYQSDNEIMLSAHGRNKKDEIIYRKYDKNIKTYGDGKNINSMEFGNRTQIAMLRIYDKKVEQLGKPINEARYRGTAKECEEWTRIELQCSQKFAWSVYETLLSLDDSELIEFIASTIYHKYHFATIKGQNSNNHKWELVDWGLSDFIINDLARNAFEPIRSASVAPATFKAKYDYYFGDKAKSGVLPFLWLVKSIYGDMTLDMLFENIKKEINDFVPTKDHWRYRQQVINTLPDVAEFLTTSQQAMIHFIKKQEEQEKERQKEEFERMLKSANISPFMTADDTQKAE